MVMYTGGVYIQNRFKVRSRAILRSTVQKRWNTPTLYTLHIGRYSPPPQTFEFIIDVSAEFVPKKRQVSLTGITIEVLKQQIKICSRKNRPFFIKTGEHK